MKASGPSGLFSPTLLAIGACRATGYGCVKAMFGQTGLSRTRLHYRQLNMFKSLLKIMICSGRSVHRGE